MTKALEQDRADRVASGPNDEVEDDGATSPPANPQPIASSPPTSGATPIGAIDACNAPGVLSVIRDLSEKAKKEQGFMLLYANIADAHFEFTGIRQLSFDPVGEHRECAMDRKLDVTYFAATKRPPGKLVSPIRYEIDRQLDGVRGSYVTCKCDR